MIIEKPVLKYPFSTVVDNMVTKFHVRSSSDKEKIKINKILQIFVLHGEILIGWKEGAHIEVISQKALNYQYLGDEGFYFQEENIHTVNGQELFNSNIKMVECRFSMYEVKTIFENKDTSI
jgi:hypothetical protein